MNKQLFILAITASTFTPAFALSEGEAALIGGLIGYGLREHNRPAPQPYYQNGYPAPQVHVYTQPGYRQPHIHIQPHVNDFCSNATHINGVYNPGQAQWVCRYGNNR